MDRVCSAYDRLASFIALEVTAGGGTPSVAVAGRSL
jgi:hypothetical protein